MNLFVVFCFHVIDDWEKSIHFYDLLDKSFYVEGLLHAGKRHLYILFTLETPWNTGIIIIIVLRQMERQTLGWDITHSQCREWYTVEQ